MRGGIDAVAEKFNCGRDRILRRCQGKSRVSVEESLALTALPVVMYWAERSNLKYNPAYRKKLTRLAGTLTGKSKAWALALLADTFNAYRAAQGGLKKAGNRRKNNKKRGGA